MAIGRVVELDKEIEQHLLVWGKDPYFKKMPKDLQIKIKDLTTYFELIRDSDGQLTFFQGQKKENPKQEAMKSFLYFYNKRYKTLVDMEPMDLINGATINIFGTILVKIMERGGSVEDYVTWFFEDFLAEKRHANMIPPNIKLCLSSNIIPKYFYARKDRIKNQQRNRLTIDKKVKVSEICIEIQKQTKDPQCVNILRELTSNTKTVPVAIEELKQICITYNCMDFITRLDEVRLKKTN